MLQAPEAAGCQKEKSVQEEAFSLPQRWWARPFTRERRR